MSTANLVYGAYQNHTEMFTVAKQFVTFKFTRDAIGLEIGSIDEVTTPQQYRSAEEHP